MKPFYLAGPMSGYPQFNFPAFYDAAKNLRKQGYVIISPAELDDADVKENAMSSPDGDPAKAHRTWGDFLSRDVKIIADQCDGIIFLLNWPRSPGARLEAFTGLQIPRFEFRQYWREEVYTIHRDDVWSQLRSEMNDFLGIPHV